MGFSSGISTDQDDLLDDFRSFALAEGWTINSFINDTSTYNRSSTSGKRLHISKNGMFFNFRSSDGANIFDAGTLESTSRWDDWRVYGIGVNGSTGYNAGNSWENQPGSPQVSGTGIGAVLLGINNASVNYWFFSTTETLTMAVEYDPVNYPGYMQFIHVGRINPSGNILTTPGDDGMVYAASMPMDYFLNDGSTASDFFDELNSDSGNKVGLATCRQTDWGRGGVFLPSVPKNDGTTITNAWHLIADGTSTSSSNDRMGNGSEIRAQAEPPNAEEGFITNLIERCPNSGTGVTPIFPIYLFLKEADGSLTFAQYRIVGTLEGVYNACHTAFTLGGTATVASDTYNFFPMWHAGQTTKSGLAIRQ